LTEDTELIVLSIAHAGTPFLSPTVTNERIVPTRAASLPSLISGANPALAALLSAQDSTLPDMCRLGRLVLEVSAAAKAQDEPTRE